MREKQSLLVVDLDLAGVDALNDGVGVLAVDGAADGLGGAEDLLDGAGERLGERLEAHLAGDLDDLLEGDVATVLDVLLLLAVARGLLERLDDERGGRGDDRDGSLTVLDGELDGDAETLPVAGGLGDVLTDLLGRETKRTDLGGKRRRGTNLTTGGTEVDDLLEVSRDRSVLGPRDESLRRLHVSVALRRFKSTLHRSDDGCPFVGWQTGLGRAQVRVYARTNAETDGQR